MTTLPARLASCAALGLLYIVLYYAAGMVSAAQHVGGLASLFFLPAFIRLLGYLLVGYQIVPTLFGAGLVLIANGAYDLGPGYAGELVVTAFTAVGGPFGVFLASWLGRLRPDLGNLTPLRLLALSIGCSAGNSLFHALALFWIGHPLGSVQLMLAVFAGDLIGTWVIIYLIKTGLTLYGRSLRS